MNKIKFQRFNLKLFKGIFQFAEFYKGFSKFAMFFLGEKLNSLYLFSLMYFQVTSGLFFGNSIYVSIYIDFWFWLHWGISRRLLGLLVV